MGVASVCLWLQVDESEYASSVRDVLNQTPLGDAWKWCKVQLGEMFSPFTNPSSEKILPDWDRLVRVHNIPLSIPQPPVLVLDLEDTLLHATWDSKNGWRYAKRPGVDEFLSTVANQLMYEVVIWSDQPQPIAMDVVMKLDRHPTKGYQNALHHLFRDKATYVNGRNVKDLSKLNRPLSRIIVIDDDINATCLNPQNAIHVTPYTDPASQSEDTQLVDLIPFLKTLRYKDIDQRNADVREILSKESYNNDATQIIPEFTKRMNAQAQKQFEQQQSGLGGLVRKRPGLLGSGPTAPGMSPDSSATKTGWSTSF